MSPIARNLAFVLSLLLLLPSIAIVAAPPPGPNISTPSISPSSPRPSDQVTVTTTVTAGNSGVLNVTLVYTTDNWKTTNTTVVASYNSTSQQATAHIPPQYSGGHVEYYTSTTTNTWIELALVAATLGVGGTIAFYSLRPKTRAGSASTSQS